MVEFVWFIIIVVLYEVLVNAYRYIKTIKKNPNNKILSGISYEV